MTSRDSNLRGSILIGVVLLLAPLQSINAATVSFILDGNAGLGLLPGNENPGIGGGGTGGIGPGGISYDTDTNVLSVDIRWGSGNGFTDLSGPVTVSHIHGFTDPAPAGFSQNRGVQYTLHTLPGFNVSATNGGFVGTVNILETDEAALLEGRAYINVHTAANPGGEIRGQLVPIPAAVWLFGSALLGLIGVARGKRAA